VPVIEGNPPAGAEGTVQIVVVSAEVATAVCQPIVPKARAIARRRAACPPPIASPPTHLITASKVTAFTKRAQNHAVPDPHQAAQSILFPDICRIQSAVKPHSSNGDTALLAYAIRGVATAHSVAGQDLIASAAMIRLFDDLNACHSGTAADHGRAGQC
jgi:hypothetical protein